MNNRIAIFFLVIFLNANTAFGEFLKLTVLIQHYIEHSAEDEDISFIRFIAEHYNGEIKHHHDKTNHEHEKLPFKTNTTFSPSVLPYVLQSDFELNFESPVITVEKIIIEAQQNYSNAYLISIWQPPRFC